MSSRPLARNEGLLVEEVEGELLVYDRGGDAAHRLNRTAAIVWRHCDGEHDVAGLVSVLEAELDDGLADEDLVRITLDTLAEKGLVDGVERRAPEETRLSRRRFIRRVGTVGVAALSLPVVSSLVAPSPAMAQSVCTQCTTCTSCTSCSSVCTTCTSCTSCSSCTSCICTSCTSCSCT